MAPLGCLHCLCDPPWVCMVPPVSQGHTTVHICSAPERQSCCTGILGGAQCKAQKLRELVCRRGDSVSVASCFLRFAPPVPVILGALRTPSVSWPQSTLLQCLGTRPETNLSGKHSPSSPTCAGQSPGCVCVCRPDSQTDFAWRVSAVQAVTAETRSSPSFL